jgi:hypothetical protein
VVRVQLDGDMRASLRAGRRTQKGDVYDVMPDAVLTIEMPGRPRFDVAVEYVTSKYTDADIRAKQQAFSKFAQTIWVGDRRHTAERVHALTGERCELI